MGDSAIMFSFILALCDNDWSFSLNLKASLVLLLLRNTLECSLMAKRGTDVSTTSVLVMLPLRLLQAEERRSSSEKSSSRDGLAAKSCVCVCVRVHACVRHGS